MAGPKIGFRWFADTQRTLLGRRRRLILVGLAVASHAFGKLLVADIGSFLDETANHVWTAELLFVFSCVSLWLYLSGKRCWRDRLMIRWGIYTGALVSNPVHMAALGYRAFDGSMDWVWVFWQIEAETTFLLLCYFFALIVHGVLAGGLWRRLRSSGQAWSMPFLFLSAVVLSKAGLLLFLKLYSLDLFVFSYAAMVVWFRKKRRLWRIADVLGIMTWCCFYLAAARTALVK
ncbi:MAG: hypothetical protein KDA87_00960 [Planctomycetales bacterium]|nr:hypothetical protein [Planctomycetales bacterium]